ncbi:MAG: hypothetical protein KDB60_09715 [Propionibacteriaceae bacterium]|nr:hypothetical protein [Propionibacteriaceae bacterium]
MPKQPEQPQARGGEGSLRARLRLVAVVLLGLLTATYLVLAVKLYFFPAVEAVASGLFGIVLAVIALLYALATRAVLRQSRVGHLLAVVLCVLAVVLGLTPGMTWIDWTVLGVNLVAVAVLLGCVPRKAPDRVGDGS